MLACVKIVGLHIGLNASPPETARNGGFVFHEGRLMAGAAADRWSDMAIFLGFCASTWEGKSLYLWRRGIVTDTLTVARRGGVIQLRNRAQILQVPEQQP